MFGSYLRQSWNVEMASSLQRVEKKSRWFSCVTLWERIFVELDVHVSEHKENVWNPKVLGASSWENKWRWCISLLWVELTRNSRWISYEMQWERRSVEWTCLWTSIGERDPSGWALVKKWFFCVMQWARDMDIPRVLLIQTYIITVLVTRAWFWWLIQKALLLKTSKHWLLIFYEGSE